MPRVLDRSETEESLFFPSKRVTTFGPASWNSIESQAVSKLGSSQSLSRIRELQKKSTQTSRSVCRFRFARHRFTRSANGFLRLPECLRNSEPEPFRRSRSQIRTHSRCAG